MATLARLAQVPVGSVKGLSGRRGQALHKAGIHTVADLLMHVPRRYIDRSTSVKIADAPVNQEFTVFGRVKSVSVRRPRRNLAIVEAVVVDETGRMKVVWFNQTYLARRLSTDAEVALSGKAERFRGRLQMKSPAVDVLSSDTESLVVGRVVPIHPAVGEATAGVMRRAIHNALMRSRPVPDTVPPRIVEIAGVAERDWALGAIHFPDELSQVEPARDRLVFDELFRLEVALALQKNGRRSHRRGSPIRPRGSCGNGLSGVPVCAHRSATPGPG
jgi:ATP-dependent DNA helicase RecG